MNNYIRFGSCKITQVRGQIGVHFRLLGLGYKAYKFHSMHIYFPSLHGWNVFPNFLYELSPSAYFLASCWECFPLTKLNKFLSVNVQCNNNCFQTQAKQLYVNKSYKLPNTTRAREGRGWNGWIQKEERTMRMSLNNRYLVTFNFHHIHLFSSLHMCLIRYPQILMGTIWLPSLVLNSLDLCNWVSLCHLPF